MSRLLTTIFALGAFGMTAACGGGDDPAAPGGGGGGGTVPANVTVSSGDGQRIVVDGQLLGPLRARVTDAQNQGVAGVTVSWEVTQGSGTLSAATSTTDASGEASIAFTAGSGEEEITIAASVSGVSGVATFTITAVAPDAITVVAGDNQNVRTGVPLAQQLVARVTASDGGPVPGAAVDWEVTTGDASLAAATSTANADGRASVELTAGNTVGPIEVTATPQGLAATATFDAQASLPVTVTVTMENIAFNAPGGGDDITIMLGDEVRWVNNDAVQHTATSTQEPTGGTPFDTGFLSQGQEDSVVPDVRGEWVYFCEVHPAQMVNARITVQ